MRRAIVSWAVPQFRAWLLITPWAPVSVRQERREDPGRYRFSWWVECDDPRWSLLIELQWAWALYEPQTCHDC